MARAITVTENAKGDIVHASPITKLIGASKIVQIADEGAEGLVIVKENNTEPSQRKTAEDRATLAAALDAAETAGIKSIELTVNRAEGELAEQAVQRTLTVNVEDFREAFADPADGNDSIVILEQGGSIPAILYVDEDLATITAAINA